MNDWFTSIVESIRNHTMTRENLEPSFGSVIYTELGFGTLEHSGIYISDGEVIDLSGKGHIRRVSLKSLQDISQHLTTKSMFLVILIGMVLLALQKPPTEPRKWLVRAAITILS